MNRARLKEELKSFSLSMFRKQFFSIYYGSISAKSDSSSFIINTKDAIFDQLATDQLIELYYQRDYRWNDASIDAKIHRRIYRQISDAKYITFSLAPYTAAYSMIHATIEPRDYFGKEEFGIIKVYDPKGYDEWYKRAPTEIPNYLAACEHNLIVIRGYGVFAYNRDLHMMAKQLAVLEKSSQLLMLTQEIEQEMR